MYIYIYNAIYIMMLSSLKKNCTEKRCVHISLFCPRELTLFQRYFNDDISFSGQNNFVGKLSICEDSNDQFEEVISVQLIFSVCRSSKGMIPFPFPAICNGKGKAHASEVKVRSHHSRQIVFLLVELLLESLVDSRQKTLTLLQLMTIISVSVSHFLTIS